MKQIQRLTFFIALGVLLSCNTPSRTQDTEMIAVFDMTDKVDGFPTAAELLLAFDLKNNPYQGVLIKTSTISDRDYNNTTALTLPKTDSWGSNEVLRKAAIKHFAAGLQACLDSIKHSDTSGHSIIFRAVIEHAKELASSKAKRKLCLLFSNLYENSGINFYNAKTRQLLQNEPESVARQLEHEATIPPLNGIGIWLIYNPKSYQDNNHYVPIARLYKKMLEAHGAIVHIGTKFSLQ